jgi:LysR family transcriptional regulator, low CO2-responsive transcriptional regulator
LLDLYKLQIFAVVVQEGSFSAAAERLYITQSAVSQHMKELELTLGRQLFHRGWRGVKLTAQGEVLYRYTRDIFSLVTEAENALTDVAQLTEGKVRLGATPGIATYLAPEWVNRFRARYPQLSAALNTGVTSQIVHDVLSQRIDIGLIEGELDSSLPARLGWLELREIEQKVVVGFRHPWWDRDSVALAELHHQPFIMRPPNSQSRIWLDRELRQHGVEPQINAEFDNLEAIKRTVATGACLAILPDYVITSEASQGVLRSIALEGGLLKRTLKLVWDKEFFFPPITRAFLDMLNEDYPALALLKGSS